MAGDRRPGCVRLMAATTLTPNLRGHGSPLIFAHPSTSNDSLPLDLLRRSVTVAPKKDQL